MQEEIRQLWLLISNAEKQVSFDAEFVYTRLNWKHYAQIAESKGPDRNHRKIQERC